MAGVFGASRGKAWRRCFAPTSSIRRHADRAGGPKRMSCNGKVRVDGKHAYRAKRSRQWKIAQLIKAMAGIGK